MRYKTKICTSCGGKHGTQFDLCRKCEPIRASNFSPTDAIARITPERRARAERIEYLYRHGKTLEEIGAEYSISRERVRQILKKIGVTRDIGGASIRYLMNARYKQKNRDTDFRYFKHYGCDKKTAMEVNGGVCVSDKNSAAKKYFDQMRNAESRGIGWEFTFPQWVKVWIDSGKFDLRGRGQGYCMARIGDTGPYSPDNVEIITIGQNFSDSYYKHPWHVRFGKASNEARAA